MKKAKLFLTVLAVLAVVGGAVAFKVKAPKLLYLCDTTAAQKVCTIENTTFTTFKTTATNAPGIVYTAGKFEDPCVFLNGTWTCTTKITRDELEP